MVQTLPFERLSFKEWLNLCVAMSSALGTAKEYAAINPGRYNGWFEEALDIHYDLLTLQGKHEEEEVGG
jgi:hypothetical protein